MYSRAISLSGLLAVLGGSGLVNAVCTGNVVAIDNIYDASCNTLHTLSVLDTPGICDSQYFLCAVGTKSIEEYDDPTTGVSYTCAADTTAETCGSDTISYCCTYGYIE
ncbi:hypothetical protein M406DRAFT_68707 [Cryphonectria parasitica EP155]|uniref:Uncharacterized protein n=1 Tax=Cryphonectria parasitica (strain ATCC 38755 / EP155) TaxID=660469 RepID=A0A9P4Y4J8_CRYP1|nr:uncharacterized protein M406DRAFT_68707 [Cryphonectria parasitica EP155]KAF3766360.1 hypothetical protein M406DRAFT_68707 [Cryphonectria parasitica EP155]